MGPATYDHTATVWRSTESKGAALREVTRSWSPVTGAVGKRIGVQTRRETRENPGGGEITGGEYLGFAPAWLDVEEGDVVQLTAGREAPRTLEVDGASRPGGHHTELVLIPWTGALE